mgnify:CR=1 FL=1
MKKTNLSILSLLLLLFVAIISCSKDNDNSINDTKGTGLIDPVEFGKLHNEFLLEAIKASKSKSSLSNKQAFMSVSIPNVSPEMQSKVYEEISNIRTSQMKDTIFSHLNTALAKTYFEEIDNALDSATNYSELENNINTIQVKIDKDLKGTDWDVIMVYAETIKASSQVWYSPEMGGKGIGFSYKLAGKSNSLAKQAEVADWVKKDGRGAGYGMVAWSFSAFFGPVGAAGFLYGAVSGAVTSSF